MEIPTNKGIGEYKFPKFAVREADGKIVAIEESIRNDYLIYNQSGDGLRQFAPSVLDVSGKYEEETND